MDNLHVHHHKWLSQTCLNHVAPEEILIFSGHNPDFHTKIGIGWQEDSPNMVKYAKNANKNFFTFTSLEPIFCHYAANFDVNNLVIKIIGFLQSLSQILDVESN